MTTLQNGDKAPNFSALDNKGNTVSLMDFQGKKLVLFFYPKANTPGCTAEACDLRDHFTELKQAGYVLLGVSADTEKAQKNFADKFEFPFPLLADTEKEVILSGNMEKEEKYPVLVVSPTIRSWLARLLKRAKQEISVLSYREIPDDQSIRIIQTIELNETSEE